jgi:hypothetical protein
MGRGRPRVGRPLDDALQRPEVKFGGEDVGGIRISHMSDIERDVRVSLTSTRGKKAKYEVKRLSTRDRRPARGHHRLADRRGAEGQLRRCLQGDEGCRARAQLKAAYDARLAALSKPPTDTDSSAPPPDEDESGDYRDAFGD